MVITGKTDEAKWRCEGCGKWLAYSQPIEFGASLALVKIFKDAHDHCQPKP